MKFNNIDEVAKAAHLLIYHSLKQLEGKTGAEFVDREQREHINVDYLLRLTKIIQQETTNSTHRSLAPTMTLGKVTSLFETNPEASRAYI